jgi:sugar phosphate isomerase/epimerase
VSGEDFNRIARQAAEEAARLEDIARSLGRLGDRVLAVMGGTASGKDRELLRNVSTASAAAKRAAAAFREASDHARRAASEEEQNQGKSGRRSGVR